MDDRGYRRYRNEELRSEMKGTYSSTFAEKIVPRWTGVEQAVSGNLNGVEWSTFQHRFQNPIKRRLQRRCKPRQMVFTS